MYYIHECKKIKKMYTNVGPTFQYKTHSDNIYLVITNMITIINQRGIIVVVRFVFGRHAFVFKLVVEFPFSMVVEHEI